MDDEKDAEEKSKNSEFSSHTRTRQSYMRISILGIGGSLLGLIEEIINTDSTSLTSALLYIFFLVVFGFFIVNEIFKLDFRLIYFPNHRKRTTLDTFGGLIMISLGFFFIVSILIIMINSRNILEIFTNGVFFFLFVLAMFFFTVFCIIWNDDSGEEERQNQA